VPWRQALALCTLAGRRPLLWLLALAALQAALPVAGLLAMMQLVDAVADGLAGRAPVDEATRAALLATALAAGVAFAGGLLRSVAAVASEHHGRRLGDASVQRLQEHAAQLDLAEFDRPAFHDAMQRAGAEAGQRPVRLTQDGIAALVALLSLLLMSALLVQVELWLPLLVAATAAPIAWVRRRHANARFRWHAEHVVEQRHVGYLGAALTGRATAKDVRVLGLRVPFAAALALLRDGLRRSLRALAMRRARDELLAHTLASAGLFGAYVYLAYDALAGGMTLGGLVLHAQAAQRVQNAIRDLLASAAGLHEHRLFLRPLVDFLQRRPTLVAAGARAAPTTPVAIALDGVSFAYPDAPRDVLTDLHLSIAPGERVALIGPNGSGKSTIVKLLCRLYDPTAGGVLVDGAPLPEFDPDAWRRRLSVLLQDASAFELSLRENLTLGNGDAVADDELWRALAVVGLADKVRALPAGLDTPWSRRLQGGADWSVGEARRLALARALAQPADVLLLDEPFASLDGKAAADVTAHLLAQPRRQTIVIIDHRGPALRCADRVVWLENGRLVATGSPDEVRRHPRFAASFPDW